MQIVLPEATLTVGVSSGVTVASRLNATAGTGMTTNKCRTMMMTNAVGCHRMHGEPTGRQDQTSFTNQMLVLHRRQDHTLKLCVAVRVNWWHAVLHL